MILRTKKQKTKKKDSQWVQEVLVVPAVRYSPVDPDRALVKYTQYIKYYVHLRNCRSNFVLHNPFLRGLRKFL